MHAHRIQQTSGQKRPRLLRASVTEPSIHTSTGDDTLVMAPSASYHSSNSAGSASPIGNGSSTYRRATDLLNHVVYLSSFATSPTMTSRRSSSPHPSSGSLPSTSPAAVKGANRRHDGSSGNSNESSRSNETSIEAYRRRNTDEFFGSSPSSSHTSSSLEDLPSHHPCSAHYYSFPSFDTYEDSQAKEED
ncbi:hypothetical protein SEPCBS119000_003604 [Sporothrix epigloea]|uniref:Uncharacterized protein n=1 Tax=Sporothrix epigloea TaxID=1892477 RepID=A0ABP0DRS1_9PEZI